MIASRARAPYLSGMTAARLVRLLTIFAVLLAPLSMVGERAAMAMPAGPEASAHHSAGPSRAGHCAEMSGQSEDEKAPDTQCLIDCAIACSAIPAGGSQMADQSMPVVMVQPQPLVGRLSGLHPESDPPPPRIA